MTYRDRDRVTAWMDSGGGAGLTPLARGILRDLAHLANSETGLSWPGTELLATRWGVHRTAVEKALRQLRAAGLVDVVQRATGQRRARYRVTRPTSSPPHREDYSGEVAHPLVTRSPPHREDGYRSHLVAIAER